MMDPQTAANELVRVFDELHHGQMAGLPLLNTALDVEALGFQEYQGRVFGVLITPWLMNLVILPNDDDDWHARELGDKVPHEFPSGTYKFLINEIDGIGRYQAHSIYSPMREFRSQIHARAVAAAFIRDLMSPTALESDPVDEELLGRILKGEETPELDELYGKSDQPEQQAQLDEGPKNAEKTVEAPLSERKISRRDLLRGNLSGNQR